MTAVPLLVPGWTATIRRDDGTVAVNLGTYELCDAAKDVIARWLDAHDITRPEDWRWTPHGFERWIITAHGVPWKFEPLTGRSRWHASVVLLNVHPAGIHGRTNPW